MPFDPVSFTKAKQAEQRAKELAEKLKEAEMEIERLKKQNYLWAIGGIVAGLVIDKAIEIGLGILFGT